MFAFAVFRLGLSPDDFWALGLSEWRALVTAAAPQGEAMTRDALTALIAEQERKTDDKRSAGECHDAGRQ